MQHFIEKNIKKIDMNNNDDNRIDLIHYLKISKRPCGSHKLTRRSSSGTCLICCILFKDCTLELAGTKQNSLLKVNNLLLVPEQFIHIVNLLLASAEFIYGAHVKFRFDGFTDIFSKFCILLYM